MRVGENQAFASQPVQIGRRDSAVTVENADIPITHITSKDAHYVRLERLLFLRSENVFLSGDVRHQQPAGQGE